VHGWTGTRQSSDEVARARTERDQNRIAGSTRERRFERPIVRGRHHHDFDWQTGPRAQPVKRRCQLGRIASLHDDESRRARKRRACSQRDADDEG
jgi:hypothetical protein